MDGAPGYFLPSDLERPVESTNLEPPALEPADITAIAAGLAESGEWARAAITTRRRVQALGQVAGSWLDRSSPHRRAAERWLPAHTGYAPEMVAHALDLLFHSLTGERIEELLRTDLPRSPGSAPRLVFLIAAGTVFPPAIVGATAALIIGSPILIKPASAEPLSTSLWARSVADVDPELGRLVAVLPWPRTQDKLTLAALEAAGAVLVHGDDKTIHAIRAAARPSSRIIAHGHRVSAAIVGASALAADAQNLARGLAQDVALYDQQGCLSPHTVFVEETSASTWATATRAFAVLLAGELAEIERSWPRGRLDPAAAASLRQFLLTRELKGDSILGGYDAGRAVVLDSSPLPARFEYSPLGRTVIVKPVPEVRAAIEALAAVGNHLQAVGLAVTQRERIALARRLGLYDDVDSNPCWAPRVRLCPVGTMQDPPLTWAADGHRPLAALCTRER